MLIVGKVRYGVMSSQKKEYLTYLLRFLNVWVKNKLMMWHFCEICLSLEKMNVLGY
ncbi:unnamed protein product [Acanthoscelides obtectus]|uniref:Uncharacterized protein n=1 Tax=Acanthoscelides obtectus TaxID=200917 RepID=A0A9P0Q734_ACAOB|nr:unnamed protein product [Acanthoscelides obtectus]CAK1648810.1 hypothetical protein AOBTE_LOCUS15893 [Acanthoscelides obtectus]